MRILLTRWPHRTSRLEEELRVAGVDVGHLPLTDQRLPEDLTELRTAVADLAAGRFTWLLVTSGTTVRMLLGSGWDGTVLTATRIGVTGAGTARVLEELTGLTSPWMPTDEASAAAILAELPVPAPDEALLLPQSAQARPELVDGLRASGWELTHVVAYETVSRVVEGVLPEGAVTETLPDGSPGITEDDVVLVTSSTAAQAWSQLRGGIRRGGGPRLVAIGAPTARTLRRLGLDAEVSEEVSAEAVLRAVRRRPSH